MDRNGSSNADALQTMAVSFLVAAAVAAALLVDFGGQGRLLDKLLGRKDDWGAQAPRITRVEAPAETGDRLTVVTGVPQDEPAAVAAPDAPAAAPAAKAAPAKNSWIKHIAGTLTEYDIKGPATQHSGASASANDAAPRAAAPSAAAPAATVAALPTAGAQPAATAQPAYVNYGGTTRSDIMSSASGPVYNFTGKKR